MIQRSGETRADDALTTYGTLDASNRVRLVREFTFEAAHVSPDD